VNKNPNIENLKSFKKGEDKRRNTKGRPKGTISKKPKLRKLIKDLSTIIDNLTEREKMIAYQLYEIVESDIYATSVSSSVNHLYFAESDFGVKIGMSKQVNKRLGQIRMYAPSTNIIKTIKYAGMFENDVHRKFANINISGNQIIGTEWFVKNDDLLSFIENIDTIEDLHKYFNPKGNGQLKLF
jgi:hypothetical protein